MLTVCPYVEYPKCTPKISNGNEIGAGNGLRLNFDILAEGMNAHVSVATFLDIHEEYRNYETYVSPTTSDRTLMPFPALKMGPGQSSRSHTADEFVLLEEIAEGIAVYEKYIGKLAQEYGWKTLG